MVTKDGSTFINFASTLTGIPSSSSRSANHQEHHLRPGNAKRSSAPQRRRSFRHALINRISRVKRRTSSPFSAGLFAGGVVRADEFGAILCKVLDRQLCLGSTFDRDQAVGPADCELRSTGRRSLSYRSAPGSRRFDAHVPQLRTIAKVEFAENLHSSEEFWRLGAPRAR